LFIWPLLGFAAVAYAAHQDLGIGGARTNDFFNDWLNAALLYAAAAVCLVGALRAKRSRAPWVLVAIGIASWAIGDTIWSIRFGHSTTSPVASVSDVFWLAWYPLIVVALVLLVHDRVPKFELHRWVDGIVVMVLVATPWVALFLQPVSEHSHTSTLDEVVAYMYPLGDAAVFGATLGVYALMHWRPGRMWLVFGLGLMLAGLADAVYSVQVLNHSYDHDRIYDALWAAAALLVAYAAWEPHPGKLVPEEATGWRAIALPLAAQVLAMGIQIYGYFHEIPRVERILTLIILIITSVQIIVTRPRAKAAGGRGDRGLLVEDQLVGEVGEQQGEQAPGDRPADRAQEPLLPVADEDDVEQDPRQQDGVACDRDPDGGSQADDRSDDQTQDDPRSDGEEVDRQPGALASDDRHEPRGADERRNHEQTERPARAETEDRAHQLAPAPQQQRIDDRDRDVAGEHVDRGIPGIREHGPTRNQRGAQRRGL
jgi:hypothetical protein